VWNEIGIFLVPASRSGNEMWRLRQDGSGRALGEGGGGNGSDWTLPRALTPHLL